MKVGFHAKTYSKNRVHQLTYRGVRQTFPELQASMVQCLRDQACEMLRREELKRLPIKKPYSSIRYNQRMFTPYLERNTISLCTVEGRMRFHFAYPQYFKRYKAWTVKSVSLSFDKYGQRFRLQLVVEGGTPEKLLVSRVLGMDSGIINHVVLSNNRFFASNQLRNVKGRYQFLRSMLQAKGTRSAKRHLKRLSGRERRFMLDINHRMARLIVNEPFEAIALEKLQIRPIKKNGKRFNRKLGNWAFRQLQRFIEYKAEALGKTVIYVNPAYTSQMCSRCGQKGIRTESMFKCSICGFELNADLNASRNIAQRGMSVLSRLPCQPTNRSVFRASQPMN
jgi:IS605 OrfB family transposase